MKSSIVNLIGLLLCMHYGSSVWAGTITVNNGAALKGTGNVYGDLVVNSGGSVEPSTTCLSVNNANFSTGSMLNASIEGNTACSDYSQLIVNGEIDLNDASLNATTNNYTLQVWDEFVLINNDNSESFLSPFDSIGENETYAIDGELLYASYFAGDGNDFSLLFKFIYPIGGSVSGLASGNEVFLQNGSGEIVSVNSNGAYQFPTPLDDGSSYDVSVVNQPSDPNQNCIISNGSGTVSGGAVTDIDVSCTTLSYPVGGSVIGLAPGNTVTVLNNGGDVQVLNNNGTFVFSVAITDGTVYGVTVSSDPTTPNQTCSVINPTGTVMGAAVTDVVINCETNTYTVGGTVAGLANGNSVTLQNNLTDDLVINADGSFTFDTEIIDEGAYAVTVLTQPDTPNQTCVITQGSGAVAGGPVTTVVVNCETDSYFVGGDVMGLATNNDVTLQNNASDDLMVLNNGVFVFGTPLEDKTAYEVTVLNQPTSPNQTCDVIDGTGSISGDDVVDVVVDCVVNTYSIGGTLTGLLEGEMVELQNNKGDDLMIFSNGVFSFSTEIDDHSGYQVTIKSEPNSPIQNCEVSNSQGQVNGANVTDISVFCDSQDLIFKDGFETELMPE